VAVTLAGRGGQADGPGGKRSTPLQHARTEQ
jgi:hypothetical protein